MPERVADRRTTIAISMPANSGIRIPASAISSAQPTSWSSLARTTIATSRRVGLGTPIRANRSLLSAADQSVVKQADYDRNFSACKFGNTYSCRRDALLPADLAVVEKADYDRNVSACRYGNAYACKPSLLSPEDAVAVAQARAQAATYATPAPSVVVAACAENESCYGDISADTGWPKTAPVSGYYRKDGTYVRGYFRNTPRRK